MDKKKGLLAAALAILLSSLLCLSLYQLDNKYTRWDTQPISGILFYSEDTELCWLTRQWVIYPDVLLSPEGLAEHTGYRYFGDIGGGHDPSRGSVSYQLTLLLPEEPREYALELPEVFSACKLYVNGRLLLQLGDPSPDAYREEIASKVVTFSAAGQTELLLAAADRSGVNRGLTYPPAFGTADAVLAAREGRLLLHGGMVLLALLGALLAVSFGLRANKRQGILTCLLCLTLAVVTGYPLYHGLLTTGVQPWYTLEPVCYYGLLLLALLLYGGICELGLRRRLILSAPCALGLAATLIRFACASILPAQAAEIFSWLSLVLKYYTSFCLLGLSLWALWHGKCHSVLLLCGSAALAACLLWDRLLPLYEPVYGSWLGEIGSILLVISLAAALWLDALDAYRFRLTYQESFQQMEQRLIQQKEHYKQLSAQVQLAREAAHDLRHHMRAMGSFAEKGQWDRLKSYLEQYEPHVKERELTLWSDHAVADAVLGYYAAKAREHNAVYDVRLAIPPDISFPDEELCIVLSNLLENAVEAIERQTQGKRRIYLRGAAADGRLGIVVDNTFHSEVHQRDGIYLSTKHPGHGLGLSSVTTIAEKYGGLAAFSAENSIFHASVFIPLPSQADKF